MVDLYSKLCDHAAGCSKQPSFGRSGGSRTRCLAHKEPGMVRLKSCPRARSSPSSGPGTSSPHHEHGPMMLDTAGGSTVSGGTGGGRGARRVRSVPAVASGGPAALLSRSISTTAVSRRQVPAANPASSPCSAGAAAGIGKRPRQAAPAPALLPIRQPAAGTTGSGSSCKRLRGMMQALRLPQATQAGLAGPSGEATPPPSAITTVNPRRRLPRLAAVTTTLAGPSCSGGQGIPEPTAPLAAPQAPPGAEAGARGAGPHVTTGRADPLQLKDKRRGGVGRKARVQGSPALPLINMERPSGAPPSGEESASLAGAAAGTRSGAAGASGNRAMGPAAASAAAKGIHSGRGAKVAQARHRPFGDGPNKR